jgi:hypothetical protein
MYAGLSLLGCEPHVGWQGRHIGRWKGNDNHFSCLPWRSAGSLCALWPLIAANHTDQHCQYQK